MARPKIPPIPISYADWLAAGCQPQMTLTAARLAAWVTPVLSTVRANFLCNRGDLYRDRDTMTIDTHHPTNLAWLKERIGAPEPKRAGGAPTLEGAPPRPPAHAAPETQPVGKARVPRGPGRPPGRTADADGSQLDIEAILHAIYERCDVSALSNADVQKVKNLESAEKVRVERMTKRGMLIERSMVAVVFAKLYQVDANQLKTLGAKLSPALAGEFGIEDAGSLLRIEQIIDTEIGKILEHIKHLMDDFLVQVGANQVEGAA